MDDRPEAGGASQPAFTRRSRSTKRPRTSTQAENPASPLQAAVCALLAANGREAGEADVKFVMHAMSDAFSEGLGLLDETARLVYVNESLCRLLGRSARALIGRTAAQVFGQLKAQPIEPAQEGSGWYRCELEIALAGGRRRVIQMAAHPLRTVRGREIGCFAVFTDVTARANVEAALRRSESELRLLSAQLMAAQELERQRIARELHDGIGQSLGGVKCALEICEAQLVRGERRGAVQKLRRLGERVRGIVDEVRRIAMDLRPATLDDLGVLAALGGLFREFAVQHPGLKLGTLVELAESDIAPAAKTAVYRIAQEALNNAATHARARVVQVSLRAAGEQVLLEVRDDGAGFDPQRFSAIDKSGRGLGLASMRERAEASGGRFILSAAPGKGTRLRVSWPLHREKP
jgi:PAS domain S-box-containing protein